MYHQAVTLFFLWFLVFPLQTPRGSQYPSGFGPGLSGSWDPLTHQGASGCLFVLLVFLFLFLFLVFLLSGPRSRQLRSLLGHQTPIVLIAWMVPHGLSVGKVEIVNVPCDILAGDEKSEVSPCSGPRYLGKKEKEEKMGGKWRRVRVGGGVREERVNTELKSSVQLKIGVKQKKGWDT